MVPEKGKWYWVRNIYHQPERMLCVAASKTENKHLSEHVFSDRLGRSIIRPTEFVIAQADPPKSIFVCVFNWIYAFFVGSS